MGEMKYSFAGIEAGSTQILAAVQTTEGLLADGEQALAKLAAVWGGNGSESYQDIQRRWHASSQDLNASLQSLASRISEAGQAMHQTETGVANMFT